MPNPRKTPADKALRSIRQAITAHTSGLSESDKLAVARGLRQVAYEIDAKAEDRMARAYELKRLHMEKLLVCQEFLKQRDIDSGITHVEGYMPVLVAGPLKITYNDESGRYNSAIYGIADAAFSHEALCLTAIQRLKGRP